jgi:hypothetical protein
MNLLEDSGEQWRALDEFLQAAAAAGERLRYAAGYGAAAGEGYTSRPAPTVH